ncbi:14627_t:CDS:2 [Cetraspora pellucida]|uniref:14627_t:CDS:1 n=1 Tax=Cetraspora pellucida TaxID=1433469 RepID=A0A9N8YW78_9GLOM|nr:14627_t:CDS:2 [Cetraspora pellucida]
MYNKNIFKIYITLITLVVSITTTDAALANSTGLNSSFPQTFPPPDLPPPIVPAWSALVDKSKYPKVPPNPGGYQCAPGPDTYYWGLTYDDGPSENTPGVLDALAQRNQKATFFVIGSRVFQNPDILARIVKEGHQIGVHTWSHTPLTTQTDEQIIAEMKWTELAIQKAVNLTPLYMRPPTGDIDDRVRGIVQQLGYKVALWNHDTFDWKSFSDPKYDLNWIPGNFTLWATNKTATTGVISLEHDLYNTSASKAPAAMDIVKANGFTALQIANCVPNAPAYVENVVLPNPASTSSPSGTSGSSGTSGPGSLAKPSATETRYVINVLAIFSSISSKTGLLFLNLVALVFVQSPGLGERPLKQANR